MKHKMKKYLWMFHLLYVVVSEFNTVLVPSTENGVFVVLERTFVHDIVCDFGYYLSGLRLYQVGTKTSRKTP